MSLTKEALDSLKGLMLAAHGSLPETDMPIVALPGANGAAVIHNLEQFCENRRRFRGTVKTSVVDDFAGYINNRAKLAPAFAIPAFVAAGKDEVSCAAIFNMGNADHPGHCDDRALLAIPASPAYVAMQKVTDERAEKFSQRTLIEFIEDWGSAIAAIDEHGARIPMAQALIAIRHMKIEAKRETGSSERQFGATRTALEQIEASSSSDQKIPATLIFSMTPFEGMVQRDMEMRVAIFTGADTPRLGLRWVGRDRVREEISTEFRELMKARLGITCDVIVGSFSAGE